MKPYIEITNCPKCKAIWRINTSNVTYCVGGTQTIKQDGEVISTHTLPDFLNCTCGNCGYEWLMECADAGPSPEPEEDEPPDDESVTVYYPADVDCPHCTERVKLAIEITILDRDCLDNASVHAVVMNENPLPWR